MIELCQEELLLINGGSEETYQKGYELGDKIKTAIVDAYDYVRGFFNGLGIFTD